MDYQAYKKEFLESLRNDSAINGTDTEDEFLNRTLSLLVDYDEVNDPVRFGMGDKRGRGNRLMRADGYCFDETDHSLILFISDFQDSEMPPTSPEAGLTNCIGDCIIFWMRSAMAGWRTTSMIRMTSSGLQGCSASG